MRLVQFTHAPIGTPVTVMKGEWIHIRTINGRIDVCLKAQTTIWKTSTRRPVSYPICFWREVGSCEWCCVQANQCCSLSLETDRRWWRHATDPSRRSARQKRRQLARHWHVTQYWSAWRGCTSAYQRHSHWRDRSRQWRHSGGAFRTGCCWRESEVGSGSVPTQ